jgi:haloalkane dehalogenase/tRNA(adenine34) deaminase
MNTLRTPDERFGQLPGFPFAPRYADDPPGFEGLRLHYVDEGPPGGEVFLCVHGEPTWAYLYRHMIPVFVRAGFRAVAPDLFGFGRSDKPADDGAYSFEFHRETLTALIRRLDLTRIALVCQDWGGLLGLTLPMEMPQRFDRLLVMNTTLGTGDAPLPEGFLAWRKWAGEHPDMETGKLLGRACPQLTEAERAAYDAPFPDVRYKAGVRRFPQLVPDRRDAPGAAISRAARDWLSSRWNGQSFMAIGMKDPVLGAPVMKALQKTIRGCSAPMELADAGHFVPEWGGRIAANALAHFLNY